MQNKDTKLLTIFINILLDRYTDTLLFFNHEDEKNVAEVQKHITSWIEEWVEGDEEEEQKEVRKHFLENTKRIYNKKIREQKFNSLWLWFAPKFITNENK